jgi:putative phage-type endonuclease
MTTTVPPAAPAAGRRVTPTGRLVLPAGADRETWLTVRRKGIGSSDIPKVMRLSSFGGPLHVYHDKVGHLPLDADEVSDAAHFGNLFEEPLARDWARRNRTVVRRVGVIAHEHEEWMQCSLDRLCTECPLDRTKSSLCAVEVKTRNAFVAGRWHRQVPDDVLAQCLWQIAVSGLEHIHVAALIGGQDYRQFTIRREEHGQVIADIVTVARRLWVDHIEAGLPPVALPEEDDPDALRELYDALNPDRDGLIRLDREMEAHDALAGYLAALEEEKAAGRRKKQMGAVLVAALGDAEMAVMGDAPVFTYKETGRDTCDLARLAERYPEAYEDCVTRTTHRRLNITNHAKKAFGENDVAA